MEMAAHFRVEQGLRETAYGVRTSKTWIVYIKSNHSGQERYRPWPLCIIHAEAGLRGSDSTARCWFVLVL